jgi:hypothetical protein
MAELYRGARSAFEVRLVTVALGAMLVEQPADVGLERERRELTGS